VKRKLISCALMRKPFGFAPRRYRIYKSQRKGGLRGQGRKQKFGRGPRWDKPERVLRSVRGPDQ